MGKSTDNNNSQAVYENRVVAFIDLLGFRELVSFSALHPEAAGHIYSFLIGIQGQQVMGGLYGGIPTVGLDGTREVKLARDLPNTENMLELIKTHWPIEITQFSDSLVLSCKAEDGATSILLLEFVVKLMLGAFQHGFLLRGGITLGLLSHQEGGPLFGPAFIEAYALESKYALWPRIIVDKTVVDLLVRTEQDLPKLKPIDQLFVDAIDIEGKRQLAMATSYRYLSMFGCLVFNVNDATEKLKTLLQTYATDEKLAGRYGALLNDWLVLENTGEIL